MKYNVKTKEGLQALLFCLLCGAAIALQEYLLNGYGALLAASMYGLSRLKARTSHPLSEEQPVSPDRTNNANQAHTHSHFGEIREEENT